MTAGSGGGVEQSIPIRAVSFEALAMDHPIGFAPPLAEHSSNPEAFEFNWHLIQFVFDLSNPRAFPPFNEKILSESLPLLTRYRVAAAELAESAFLSHSSSVTISFHGGDTEEQVEKSFPPKENVRGFSVLFRQFYSTDELASFKAAHSALWLMNERAGDDHVDVRKKYLRTWGRAASRLRGFNLKLLVSMKLQEQGVLPAGPQVNGHLPGPEMLISIYNYGDDIHWGEKRQQLAAWDASPFDSAWMRLACFEAMTGLAHVYLGFSELVGSAITSLDGSGTSV